jgi:uncharacterized membrane protein
MFVLARNSMVLWMILGTSLNLIAQDSKLIDFQEHVQPILERRCLECHGPDEAKNDLRVDRVEDLLAYVEAGDLEASSLWTDYLTTEDPDMLMPPPTALEQGGLPVAELLVIKAWIEEGAEGQWLEEEAVGDEAAEAEPQGPTSVAAKLWALQGLFHPATVHFPVALLTVSALFVLLSFFNRANCEPVAFHCLWIGALGAIVACLAGWSYAVYRGYGAGVGFDLEASAIDRHRWAGVFVAVFAVLTVPLAASVRRTGGFGKRLIWLLASCILAFSVSLAGYQGGELTYGEDHYFNYYQKLFGTTTEPVTEPVNDPKTDPIESDQLEESLTPK